MSPRNGEQCLRHLLGPESRVKAGVGLHGGQAEGRDLLEVPLPAPRDEAPGPQGRVWFPEQ